MCISRKWIFSEVIWFFLVPEEEREILQRKEMIWVQGLKKNLTEAGPWYVSSQMQGETIPKETNHVRLSKDQKDAWGIPELIVSVDYDENDVKSMKDYMQQTSEMLEMAGCKNIQPRDTQTGSGTGYS